MDRYLPTTTQQNAVPKALIVPHAGYVYSGPIAGSAYVRLIPARQTIRRVVLIGPSHRMPFDGIATSRATAFRTPLGEVPLDTRSIALLLSLPMVRVIEAAHEHEHSLEVQLPFLQTTLAAFSIVPLLTGRTTPEEVAHALQAVWGGSDTVIVVSTDLTHYLPYAASRQADEQTARAILELDADAIGPEDACGAVAVRGMLLAARRNGLKAELLDLRNSGDTAGPRDAVVGYGAFAFS
jgi:AmmeMemoRadiSam system protein B